MSLVVLVTLTCLLDEPIASKTLCAIWFTKDFYANIRYYVFCI